MENMITIRDLIFEYRQDENKGSIRAVDGVNLSVEEGEWIAVIGRNGSGKSTLAKNINALLLPSGGAVYIQGADTADESKLWEIRQTVGMVFQNPDNQLVSSVVEDDVAFGPENLGIDPAEIRCRVDRALLAVGMEDEAKKAPHLLSGGQKQRVAIAGAIAMRPACIVFDEPTAMLDPSGRREVMRIIRQLNREGTTVVLITHFMEEAACADRIVIMDEGKIVMAGAPVEVFRRADVIRQIGLSVPLAVELSEKLRRRDVDVPADVIDMEGLVAHLCQYK